MPNVGFLRFFARTGQTAHGPVRAEIQTPFERRVSGWGQTELFDRDGVVS